jgi:hypothetical protein
MMTQKLIPLIVPWQIYAADASLHLSIREQGITAIEFLALFAYQAFEQDIQAGLIACDSAAYLGLAAKQAPFHKVIVTLGNVAATRCQPVQGDVLKRTAYDCSAIPSLVPPDKSQTVQAYDFKKYWNDNKRCPDPGAYKVEHSEWLHLAGLSGNDYIHYLFLGQQLCIEVLATDMQWKLTQPVFYCG